MGLFFVFVFHGGNAIFVFDEIFLTICESSLPVGKRNNYQFVIMSLP